MRDEIDVDILGVLERVLISGLGGDEAGNNGIEALEKAIVFLFGGAGHVAVAEVSNPFRIVRISLIGFFAGAFIALIMVFIIVIPSVSVSIFVLIGAMIVVILGIVFN